MERGKTYYYSDELNDDFAGNSIEGLKIGRDYSFAPDGVLWRICEFIVYYLIAIPAVFVICFVFSGFSIKNRKAVSRLRRARKERGGKGFFIYANHTHWLDAFIAPLVCFPQKAHVITSPDVVSIKGLGVIVKMLGAI
ncbi:MAG: hypothetical protein II747_02750, partial [Clostridia bacterium]|nr:hypothetical protein [Clostridia bacterium]